MRVIDLIKRWDADSLTDRVVFRLPSKILFDEVVRKMDEAEISGFASRYQMMNEITVSLYYLGNPDLEGYFASIFYDMEVELFQFQMHEERDLIHELVIYIVPETKEAENER